MKIEKGTIKLTTIERVIAIVAGLGAIFIPTYTVIYYFGQQDQRLSDQGQTLSEINTKIDAYDSQTEKNTDDIATIQGQLSTYLSTYNH